MDKHISYDKKLKAISVSTVGNEWPREARVATQSPNGTENLIRILFLPNAEKNPDDTYMFIYLLPFSAL